MNTFRHQFYIGEALYTVFIDSSKDEWKRIVINNKELINEKYTLYLNRNAYTIYYPIDLNGNELVVSIDDSFIIHDYNIYLNGISLLDQSHLEKDYAQANKTVETGLKAFIVQNFFRKSIKAFLFVGTFIVIKCLSQKHFNPALSLLLFLLAPIFAFLLILLEWSHNKSIVKKYKKCFRPKITYL